MKKIYLVGFTLIVIFKSCKQYEPEKSYAANLKVEGNGLAQISFQSANNSFDVAPLPMHLWSVDNVFKGNDTISLYGRQVTDTANPITVTIRVDNLEGTTQYFTKTDPTGATVKVWLPK